MFHNKHSHQTLKQFLIIQTASLGDVILSTALAESLHKRFPDAAIDYLVKQGYEGLFKGHPFIRTVHSWNKRKKKYRNLINLAIAVRKTKYDAVVNVQRFFTSGFLTAFSGSPVRSGFDKNPLSFTFSNKVKHEISRERNAIHETERNHQLLSWIADIKISKPGLYPSKSDYSSTGKWTTGRYITISPASLWYTKQFPVHKWIEFVNNIQQEIGVILLGASDDQKLCQQIIAGATKSGVVSLSGRLDFLQSAAVMKGALMNFVNDSAPMHLASGVNAPVTAVYCSTVPAFGFGPLSDDSGIIEAIPVPECRPCGLHGLRKCPLNHFKCAETINTEQLLDRLDV